MNLRTITYVTACAWACACGNSQTDQNAVEPNDLGITKLEVRHDVVQDDRVLTVRGFDEDGTTVATAVLRTGMVLYGADTAEELHAGTELKLTVGHDTALFVSPDRLPHMIYDSLSPGDATFVGLHGVASEIEREAGIKFAPPKATGKSGEIAFTAANCTASRWPTAKGNVPSCCEDTTATYSVNTKGQIVNRSTYVPSWPSIPICRKSDGTTGCAGTDCLYGPCGAAIVSVKGLSGGHVFHPTSNPNVCGWDDAGAGGLGTDYSPEHYSSQSLYGGVTSTCTCSTCNADGTAQCSFFDDFNRTSGLGSNWSVSSGSWTTDGSYAVAGTWSDNYARVVASPGIGTADYTVSATIKSNSSGTDVTGVYARSDSGNNNLYAAGMAAGDGYITLRRQNGSTWTWLAQTDGIISTNTDHDLKLVVTGSNPVRLQVWLDGVLKIYYEDSSASRITSVGYGGLHTQYSGIKYNQAAIDPASAISAPPVLPFSDSFNRTATNLGGGWTTDFGAFSTDGFRAIVSDTTNEAWAQPVVTLGTADYSVQADVQVPTSSASAGVYARSTTPEAGQADSYAARITTTGLKLFRYSNWSQTTLATYNTTITTGTDYTVKLSVSGTNPVVLTVYLNGTQRITYNDSSSSRHTSGTAGITAGYSSNNSKWGAFTIDTSTGGGGGGGGGSQWSLVQTAEAWSTSISMSSSGAGHLIVVAVEMGSGTSGTVNSITDNKGNTYVSAGARCITTSLGASEEIWYAKNVASGVTSVSINASPSGNVHAAVVWEVAAINTTSPLQTATHADNQSSSSTPLGASITTSAAGEFVVAITVVENNVQSIHSGNPFTNDRYTNGNGFAHLTSNTAAAGTYQAQWDVDYSGPYCSSSAAFFAAP